MFKHVNKEHKNISSRKFQPFLELMESRVALALTTIGFDDLQGGTFSNGIQINNQYQAEDIVFSPTVLNPPLEGFSVLNSSTSLLFPSVSGTNVAVARLPLESQGGVVIHTVDKLWTSVGAYVTGIDNVILTAYDSAGKKLGQVSTGGGNTGHPNLLLSINANNIASASFLSLSDFALDNVQFMTPEDDPFVVPEGQFTFDAEGQDDPTKHFFSRDISWPGGASGVTIGRGYDLKFRTEDDVISDLLAAGIPSIQAYEIAGGVGLSGVDARLFVKNNQAIIGNITPTQQQKLFEIDYSRYVVAAYNIYQSVYNTDDQSQLSWNSLSQKTRDILVDIAYQNGTFSSLDVGASVAASFGDISGLVEFIESSPGLVNQDSSRHRIQYLE